MTDEVNESVSADEVPTQNSGGPVPGSSPITVEDAPPVTTPEPTEEPQLDLPVEAPPAPAPVPIGTPTDAKTLQEQALGRAKVEESEARERLRSSANADNANTPGGEDARIAASKEVNSEL